MEGSHTKVVGDDFLTSVNHPFETYRKNSGEEESVSYKQFLVETHTFASGISKTGKKSTPGWSYAEMWLACLQAEDRRENQEAKRHRKYEKHRYIQTTS